MAGAFAVKPSSLLCQCFDRKTRGSSRLNIPSTIRESVPRVSEACLPTSRVRPSPKSGCELWIDGSVDGSVNGLAEMRSVSLIAH